MKRFLSLLLSLSILLTLCGCSENAAGSIPSHTEKIPTTTVDTPPAADTTVAEKDPATSEPESPEPPDEEDIPAQKVPEKPEEPEEYIRTIDPFAPMVALTFDDGPHDTYSDVILDVLEKYHAVATFFEVGRNVRAYPDILRRMAALGCEIASHSNVHHDLTTLSKDAMLTDLGYADDAFIAATGLAPMLVRPPYGAVNKTVKSQTGRAMITWTIDTKDWLYRDSQILIEYFQSLPSLDGEIVLMHSIHGSTAEAMKTVVPWLIGQGYQLVTVTELLAYYYGVLPEANTFYNQTWFVRHERTEYPLELPAEPLQPQIPEYTIVPVVPVVQTPSDETPPETGDTPPTDESPSTDPEVPDAETPSAGPELPPDETSSPDAPPATDESTTTDEPPATDESPTEGGENQTCK